MQPLQSKQVEDALAAYRDPYLALSLAEMRAIAGIDVRADRVRVAVELGYAAAGNADETRARLAALVEPLAGGRRVVVDLTTNVVAHKAQAKIPFIGGVRNIVAVASGKGGVGKSTTAVNLALALEREGARVGLLDADIYGPSQGIMLGVAGQRPEVREQKYFVPIKAHGIVAMSMSFLVDEQTPMVWRGPMVSSALQQMLMQTEWGELDYLVIDMPPGTGDIQLTLAQRVPVSGAVIVTTPQDIALADAVKGIEMFRKVDIPVLGVVENMSVHVCSRCGHVEHLFGEGGGERVANRYDTVLLGALPLSVRIREQTDAGTPCVVAEPDGPVAALYRGIARHVGARLALQALRTRTAGPTISIEDC
jgi:ATP-binding protein involved in chromosome partitioning